ncbi:hypothetical protein [Acidihalobacter ferrooxydans]|uniref:hypothetical protein n=1 Tax=Acidihalobacter ferrooxydans TaxID=1765967 RepID=UPI0012EC3341|nr:hypothetical protein [Acidihalobacter ferrooxydans]
MSQRILIPTGGSAMSAAVPEHAVRLAREQGARLLPPILVAATPGHPVGAEPAPIESTEGRVDRAMLNAAYGCQTVDPERTRHPIHLLTVAPRSVSGAHR